MEPSNRTSRTSGSQEGSSSPECPSFKLDDADNRLSRSDDGIICDGSDDESECECSEDDKESGNGNDHSACSDNADNEHSACSTQEASEAWDALVGSPPTEAWGALVSPPKLRPGGGTYSNSGSPKQALFRNRTTGFAPPDAAEHQAGSSSCSAEAGSSRRLSAERAPPLSRSKQSLFRSGQEQT